MSDTSNSKKILCEDIKDCLSDLKSVRFGFIKLGERCDASQSKAFTSAWCNIQNIKETGKKNYVLDSEKLFQTAINSLERFEKGHNRYQDPKIVAAMDKLKSFYDSKGMEFCTNKTNIYYSIEL